VALPEASPTTRTPIVHENLRGPDYYVN
jgi:hypothetical protein